MNNLSGYSYTFLYIYIELKNVYIYKDERIKIASEVRVETRNKVSSREENFFFFFSSYLKSWTGKSEHLRVIKNMKVGK